MGIEDKHDMYTGTTLYYKFNPFFKSVLATDGSITIADEYGAYWLLEEIAGLLPKVDEDQHLVIALLKHSPTPSKSSRFILTLQDDIPLNKLYAEKKIPFSDFPQEGIRLYVGRSEDKWVIYLPSEH